MQIERAIMPNVEIELGELLEVALTTHPNNVITYKVVGIDEKYVHCEEVN